ncbi:GNAT family N-acetyltransferase [Micromonospora schwarzwaldensis]|uniref:GNAT family N-acetyltransferase n=1 Tax=Micromonospora sp. DSM 45708 TaxID=3111767 RepID=UPI0031D8F65C
MGLIMVEVQRPVGERRWFPFTFEEAGLGFNERWWYNNPVYPRPERTFLRVTESNSEVARVSLGDDVDIRNYAEVPPLGAIALEIRFIEVHSDHRGRGIGRTVVDLLHDRYPERRLVAFSEGADGFWSSLDWPRYLHIDPEEASRRRPLFIQP